MVGLMYWVYVLKAETFERSYVGHTNDLVRRLAEHNAGTTPSTKRYLPWKVIYTEECASLSAAVLREKYLKSRSGRRFLKSVVFS